MRIALLTLEALANARAVRRFVAECPHEIALVGLSDPYRPAAGGMFGQTWRRLRQSGPRILPYLALNFAVPGLLAALAPRRGRAATATPLKELCRRRSVPTGLVRDVNGAELRDTLARTRADLILSFHFDQILSAETIASVPLGGINVHAGLLPQHRGPVPTIHALLDRPVAFGVSVHRLVPRIDAGGLLAQAALSDEPGLTALGAAARLHEAALPLLDRVLADIAAGRVVERPGEALPYRGFPSRAEMARLAAAGRSAAGWRDLREAVALSL